MGLDWIKLRFLTLFTHIHSLDIDLIKNYLKLFFFLDLNGLNETKSPRWDLIDLHPIGRSGSDGQGDADDQRGTGEQITLLSHYFQTNFNSLAGPHKVSLNSKKKKFRRNFFRRRTITGWHCNCGTLSAGDAQVFQNRRRFPTLHTTRILQFN